MNVSKYSKRKRGLSKRAEEILNPEYMLWWNGLNDEWKSIFNSNLNLKSDPTNNDFQKIQNLNSLDCFERPIRNLQPLSFIRRLQSLNLKNTKIGLIHVLGFEIKNLNCEVTPFWDL